MKFRLAVLICSVLCLLLLACSSNENDVSDTVTSVLDETTTIAGIVEESEILVDVPDSDFDKYEYTIAILDFMLDTRFYMNSDTRELSGDLINDAIYLRNRAVEEKFNITITQNALPDIQTSAKNTILAGDKIGDSIITRIDYINNWAIEGLLYNLYDVPYLDMDKPYWDQNLRNELSFKGKLYFNTGDITVMDDMRTACLIFNKGLWEDHSLPNPYDMVKNMTWTFDSYYTTCLDVTNDLDGDGAYTENDLWGIMSEKSGGNFFFFASGEHMVKNNADGVPEIALGGSNIPSIVEGVMKVNVDPKIMIYDKVLQPAAEAYLVATQLFQENKVLIRTAVFEPVPRDLRAMETDFGVLPMPLYNESQSRYSNVVLADGHALCIPVSIAEQDLERTGIITEYLAYASVDTLTEEFHNVSVTTKFLRDTDSLEMIKLIFDTKLFDFGFYYQIGDYQNIFRNMVDTGSNDFISKYESSKSSAESKLTDIIEQFSMIN
jgi:hypothetical protein